MISHVSGAECHAYTWHCRASRFFNYINENLQRNKSAPILTCSGGHEEKGIHTCSVDTLSFQRCHSVFACHPILVPSAFISHWQWKSSTLANRRATLVHMLDLHSKKYSYEYLNSLQTSIQWNGSNRFVNSFGCNFQSRSLAAWVASRFWNYDSIWTVQV